MNVGCSVLCSSTPKHACSRLQFPLTQKKISSGVTDAANMCRSGRGHSYTFLLQIYLQFHVYIVLHWPNMLSEDHMECMLVSDTRGCIDSLGQSLVQAALQAC